MPFSTLGILILISLREGGVQTMNDFVNRIIRAARLEPQLYEEVEADKEAMVQAMGVVVISSLAAGIGSSGLGFGHLIGQAIGALVMWLIWSIIIYFVGTRLLPEQGVTEADYGQLLRTIGFASSPGIVRILGIIPPFREIVLVLANVWLIAATVIAVRQALDYTSTGRAVIVCIVSFFVALIPIVILWGSFSV